MNPSNKVMKHLIDLTHGKVNSIFRESENIASILKHLNLFEGELTSEVRKWDSLEQVEIKKGDLPYFPPLGWKGYNINIQDKYDEDPNCSGDWAAVGYHGVSSNTNVKIPSIIRGGFLIGHDHPYTNEQDCHDEKREVGAGIYFTNKVDEAAKKYSTRIEGEDIDYLVVLQCKLYAQEVRRPQSRPNHYVVPKSEHARPYRVLVKELQKKESFLNSPLMRMDDVKSRAKEEHQNADFSHHGGILSGILSEILSWNQKKGRNEVEVDHLLIKYRNTLEKFVVKKQEGGFTEGNTIADQRIFEERKLDDEEEYYASGCVLNFHLRCVRHLKSNEEIEKLINQASKMVYEYGSKLIPHESYRLHKEVPSQDARKIDHDIRENWRIHDKTRSFLVDLLSKDIAHTGNRVELLLSHDKPPKERDCFSLMTSTGYHNRFVKVTLLNRDEKDFEKMSKDRKYAETIYREVRQAIINFGKFKVTKESDIKIVAFECNSPVTGYALLFGDLSMNAFECEMGERQLDQMDESSGVSITTQEIIRYLMLYENELTGDFKTWDDSQEHTRGGLPYIRPKGWTGYNLNVSMKYGQDRPEWLNRDTEDWAIGFHGVSSNTSVRIPSIIRNTFLAGLGQRYESYDDCHIMNRKVGKGIYFANDIHISEDQYSSVVPGETADYIFLLQCKLYAPEVRRPQTKQEYYIVPSGEHARPYRIMVKEYQKSNTLSAPRNVCHEGL